MTLELTNIDGEQDAGTLLIESNDPDEALLEVALVSEISGDILVGTCVITTLALTQDCVTNPEAVDFGDLPFDAVATQDVGRGGHGGGGGPSVGVVFRACSASSQIGNTFTLGFGGSGGTSSGNSGITGISTSVYTF